MNKFLSLFLLASLMFNPCFSQKKKKQSGVNPLAQKFTETENSYLTGFVLKDMQSGSMVYEHNANKNFVLGSNTKIFTLLGGLHILKDSIASFQYVIKADSLIIWPMGDPTFLHSEFSKQPAFDFLKETSKHIYLAHGRYKGGKFGEKWAWDNYDRDIQTEITDFPIYGNVVSYKILPNGKSNICPDLATMYFAENTTSNGAKRISRLAENNNLRIPANLQSGYFQKIPLTLDPSLQAGLLTDTLLAAGHSTTSVVAIQKANIPAKYSVKYNAKTLNVYKALLKNNESLFGEQLLLNYCASLNKPLSTEAGIQESLKYFTFPKENLSWKDGSGLSPLNMSTPNTIVAALEQINTKVNNPDLMFKIFGGNKTDNIYAQQGGLENTYNTSGYIIGKSGKKYVFSFLNNNVNNPGETKVYVNNLLKFIQENY
ncbi:D-alanyl-D-alanine carboxypeptidase [Pseudopedobacter sp.]|uniref:D-alanyl-D-alanine carboxypeptidase n=1 Tax=Pseudopedobacter sp. TaxID=1936787 RepID=UPI00334030CE